MNTLKIGDNNADVKTLQEALASLGYTIVADGDFGPGTQAVVMQFQKDHNLSADGIVGPNTWAVINDQHPDPQSGPIIYGIDVSHFNGNIDWNNVPKSLVNFVYCKASQGATYKDPTFAANINQLAQLGFYRGGYHFFVFQGAAVQDQVSNFLGCGMDYSQPGALPPVIDIEWQASASLNQYIIANQAACIAALKEWLTTVQLKTSRVPMIYTNSNFWHDYLGNPPGFEQYPLWVASYRNDAPVLPAGWPGYAIWQFSQNSAVTGITGNVDKDRFNGSMAQLKQLANS